MNIKPIILDEYKCLDCSKLIPSREAAKKLKIAFSSLQVYRTAGRQVHKPGGLTYYKLFGSGLYLRSEVEALAAAQESTA